MKNFNQFKIAGLGCLILIGGCLTASRLSQGQEAAQVVASGWLEGTAHWDDGRAVNDWPPMVRLFKDGQEVKAVGPKGAMDGLYEFHDVRPGVYEVRLDKADKHKALRYWGVVIKPGVRTKLDIIIPEGEGVQEIGQPALATDSAVVISNELARLQKEIDALKK